MPQNAAKIPAQAVDDLCQKWVAVARDAAGILADVEVQRDDWNEARLRALCNRHGWEFEWMTEAGERRRRVGERQSLLTATAQLTSIRDAAKTAAAMRESNRLSPTS